MADEGPRTAPDGSACAKSGQALPASSARRTSATRSQPRRVKKDGYVRFQGQAHFLSEALAKELTGWVEVDEGAWEVWCGPVELALCDARKGRIRPLGPGQWHGKVLDANLRPVGLLGSNFGEFRAFKSWSRGR